jgi:hypothetical protein
VYFFISDKMIFISISMVISSHAISVHAIFWNDKRESSTAKSPEMELQSVLQENVPVSRNRSWQLLSLFTLA